MQYELKNGIEYALKGQMETASFIEMNEPTSKHLSLTAPIKQMFFRALRENAEKNAGQEAGKADESEITGDILIQLLYTSSEDVGAFFGYAKELLSYSGLCLLDGEVKLNKLLLDNLSADDMEGLAGAYVANFILASVFATASEK